MDSCPKPYKTPHHPNLQPLNPPTMAVFIPTKHVTAPLDERVRARLRGEFSYASSGSDHDGTTSTSDDLSCFSSLLNYFLLDSPNSSPPNQTLDSDEETNSSSTPNPSKSLAIPNHLHRLLSPPPSLDPFRSNLISTVQLAASTPLTGSVLRRSVMCRLRELGFNAGICKARWDGSHGLTAGTYEYIDVVVRAKDEDDEIRYIVDLGFAAEFEVARATEEYERISSALPEVMVALVDEVREAVIVMAGAVSRSFKSRGMSVPPWRKKRYMMMKWLGFYRRTVNCFAVEREGGGGLGVTCRLMGFGEN